MWLKNVKKYKAITFETRISHTLRGLSLEDLLSEAFKIPVELKFLVVLFKLKRKPKEIKLLTKLRLEILKIDFIEAITNKISQICKILKMHE